MAQLARNKIHYPTMCGIQADMVMYHTQEEQFEGQKELTQFQLLVHSNFTEASHTLLPLWHNIAPPAVDKGLCDKPKLSC